MACCHDRGCALCQAKYASVAIARAHEVGSASLTSDCPVNDNSVDKKDLTLISKIYPLIQSALRNKPVFVGNLGYLRTIKRYALQNNLEINSGTLQKQPPKSIVERAKSAKSAGVKMCFISTDDQANIKKDKNLFLCTASGAVFWRTAIVKPTVTVADVLWRTSKVFIYQHGPAHASCSEEHTD